MEILTFFLLKLSYTTTLKRWATLFDLWGFSYMRFLENEMSQDDTRLVGWLLWLAKHSFLSQRYHFSSIKVLNEKYCVLFAFFEPSFCTMFLTASSCDIWKNKVAQMISSLNFRSETQAEPWEVNRKGFETKKRRCGDTMAKSVILSSCDRNLHI